MLDLTNQRFHQLLAVRPDGRSKDGYVLWECICDCGNVCRVTGHRLVNGNTKSCGCRKTGVPSRFTPEELAVKAVWKGMIARCFDPRVASYRYYGGEGVTVCSEWRESLSHFARDMGPRPSKAHTIDRIDGSKGYEPGNCRWATKAEQTANRRNSINVVVDGAVMSLREAARAEGIPYDRARYKVERGTFHPALPRSVSKRRQEVST